MTAHKITAELFEAANEGYAGIVDPGDTGLIHVDRSPAYMEIKTAGVETRTLKDPGAGGLIFIITMRADGGTCTVTADSTINQAGNTVMPFDTVNDSLMLYSIQDGSGTFAWRVGTNDGLTLS
jgi:hypothetical protein